MVYFLARPLLPRIWSGHFVRRHLASSGGGGAGASANASTQSIQVNRPWWGRLARWALLGGGTAYFVYTWYETREVAKKYNLYEISPNKLTLYRLLPLGCLTKLAGRLAQTEVPSWLRSPVYGSYAWVYGCDLEECDRPLGAYRTFGDFFTRALKEGSRPLAQTALISPTDGQVIGMGRVEVVSGGGGMVRSESVSEDAKEHLFPETIKGLRYPLGRLLGQEGTMLLDLPAGKDLYYCVLYLAPGSYHRFHSPVERWHVERVHRIAGEVLPVAPWALRLIRGLVMLNERAVIAGRWQHGRLLMVPVGATSVRSISLRWPDAQELGRQRPLGKGAPVGQFEMGSLLVLLFEAPQDMLTWKIKKGEWIKYGQALGDVPPSTWWWPW